jgi:tetratricopeptide (TPR) repeat protein
MERAKNDKALALLSEIKADESDNYEAFMLQGAILTATGKTDDAIETYKTVSYIKEDYAPAYCARGDIYLGRGYIDRAKEMFLKAAGVDSTAAAAEWGLARVAKLENRVDEYARHLTKAHMLDPDNTDIPEMEKPGKK